MSMHQGLDLSRFKKVSSDKKTTTLRHEKGHEIKICHSGLTPKMREHLDRLPMHKGGKVKRMAEGGAAEALDPDSPEPASEGAEPTAEDKAAMEGQDRTPDDNAAAEGQQGTPEDSAAMEGQAPMVPKPDHIPLGGEVTVVGQRRPSFTSTGGGDYDLGLPPAPAPLPTVQELNNQDALFASDLQKGHITPETYHSLFAKKDTLGKIGTIFGMLLSGAGSGLAHQPNALIEMMNKEIDRDLDAQKSSNANAQNWYRLNLQHERQKAEIPLLESQTAMHRAQIPVFGAQANAANAAAYQHAVAGDLERAKLGMIGGDLKASNAARNQMLMGMGQTLQGTVNKLPEGPTKVQGQKTLESAVYPAIQAQIRQNNAAIVAKLGALHALTNPAPAQAPAGAQGQGQAQPQQQGAVNYPALQQMIDVSRRYSSMGLPPPKGAPSEGDIGKIEEEAKDVEANRVAVKMYDHAFRTLQNAFLKGKLNEELYNSETATLGPEIARATAGRFNLTEANKQTSGMFPSWKDFGNAAKEKYNNAIEYFKGKEASTPTLNRFPQLKTPFPTFPSPFGEASPTTSKTSGAAPKESPKPAAGPGYDWERTQGGWKKVRK